MEVKDAWNPKMSCTNTLVYRPDLGERYLPPSQAKQASVHHISIQAFLS